MAALITFEDLAARPGFDGVDQGEAEAVITDASSLVAQIAGLSTPWTAETVPDAVVPVLVSMVRRGLNNPLGHSGETLGDYTWQGAGGLYATRAEQRIIRKAAGRSSVSSVNLDSPLPLPPFVAGGGFENQFMESL